MYTSVECKYITIIVFQYEKKMVKKNETSLEAKNAGVKMHLNLYHTVNQSIESAGVTFVN